MYLRNSAANLSFIVTTAKSRVTQITGALNCTQNFASRGIRLGGLRLCRDLLCHLPCQPHRCNLPLHCHPFRRQIKLITLLVLLILSIMCHLLLHLPLLLLKLLPWLRVLQPSQTCSNLLQSINTCCTWTNPLASHLHLMICLHCTLEHMIWWGSCACMTWLVLMKMSCGCCSCSYLFRRCRYPSWSLLPAHSLPQPHSG